MSADPNPHCLPNGISSDLLAAILERAPIGFAFVAECGKLLWVNDEVCRIWKRPRTELLTLRWQDITHPDDVDADENRVQQVISGDLKSYDLAKRYTMPDGRHKWALLTVFGVDQGGAPLVSMIQTHDDAAQRSRYARGFSGTIELSETHKKPLEAIANARKSAR